MSYGHTPQQYLGAYSMDIWVIIICSIAITTFAVLLSKTLRTRRKEHERRQRIMSRYRE
jgi:hypothetical protein